MGSRQPYYPPFNRMGRGRDFADRFYCDRYQDFEFYLDNLAIDPQARRMMGRDVYEDDPRDFNRRQSTDDHRIDSRPCQPRAGFNHEDHGARHEMTVAAVRGNSFSAPTAPFGKAMKELHRKLGQFEELYNKFLSEYDNDTAGAARYASAATLNSIWRAKVAGERDPATVNEGEQQDVTEVENFEVSFREAEEALAKTLEAAASSAFRSSSTQRRGKSTEKRQAQLEAAERMKTKAGLAEGYMINLMRNARKDREHCRQLLNELQQLKSLVDPEAEFNKVLFKSDDVEDGTDGTALPRGGRE